MLTTLKQTMVINFSTMINALIYFLKRIPLVKGLFKNTGYEHSSLSRGVVGIAFFIKILKVIIIRICLLLFTFGVPALMLIDKPMTTVLDQVYWHLFICFYIILTIVNNKMLEPGKRKFISVKLMRMDARRFVLADYFPEWMFRLAIEMPLFYVVANIFGVNTLIALFLIIAKNFFAFAVEALHLIYHEKTGEFLHKKSFLIIAYAIGILILGYYPAIKQSPFIFSSGVLVAIGVLCMVVGIVSLRYLLLYPNFSIAINEANKLSDLAINKEAIGKQAQFANVKLKDQDITKEEIALEVNNKKEGFAYINDIFFKRHKRILVNPVLYQGIGIVVLFLSCMILSFFLNDFNTKYIQTINRLFPIFVFVLYYLSTGQKATKAMFYNCDISLLHYGFYKSNQAVLATFTVRVKHLIITNLIPAVLLGGGLLLLDGITGGSGYTLLPVSIMIVVISIFFSIHHLFLYYIFQPYTTDLSVKNPLFTIANLLTYFLSYICLQLEDAKIGFLIGVIVATAIYSVVALLLVYKFAPKTFVIK